MAKLVALAWWSSSVKQKAPGAESCVLSVCVCSPAEIVMERDSFLVKALERASQQQDQEELVGCTGCSSAQH